MKVHYKYHAHTYKYGTSKAVQRISSSTDNQQSLSTPITDWHTQCCNQITVLSSHIHSIPDVPAAIPWNWGVTHLSPCRRNKPQISRQLSMVMYFVASEFHCYSRSTTTIQIDNYVLVFMFMYIFICKIICTYVLFSKFMAISESTTADSHDIE